MISINKKTKKITFHYGIKGFEYSYSINYHRSPNNYWRKKFKKEGKKIIPNYVEMKIRLKFEEYLLLENVMRKNLGNPVAQELYHILIPQIHEAFTEDTYPIFTSKDNLEENYVVDTGLPVKTIDDNF